MRVLRGLPFRFVTSMAILALCSGGLLADAAYAHGEGTQGAWVRTGTATFFDLNYSGATSNSDGDLVIGVGQPIELSGRIKISDQFPQALLGNITLGYVGLNAPGPVVTIRETKVNGMFEPGSVEMTIGGSYTFSQILVGRRPGRWHIHPRLDLEGKGAIVGSGRWIRVTRGAKPYVSTVTLPSGKTIDLERYGLRTVIGWQGLWAGIALVWIVYWCRRGNLTMRILAARNGAPDSEFVSRGDRTFSLIAIGTTLTLVIGGFVYANARWDTIPLQVRRERPPWVAPPPSLADITARESVYDQHRGTLTIAVQVKNTTDAPVSVERLVVSTAEFVTQPFSGPAAEALTIDPPGPIAPGDERTIRLEMQSRLFSDDFRLGRPTSVSRIGGLLILRTQNERSWADIAVDLVSSTTPERGARGS